MSVVVIPVAVVTFMMACGFFSVRGGLLSSRDITGIARFTISVSLPLLLLDITSRNHFTELFDPAYFWTYFVASIAMFAGGFFLSRLILKNGSTDSSLIALAVSCSNSGLIGFPIVAVFDPEIASRALMLNLLVETLILLPMCIAILENSVEAPGKQHAPKGMVRRITASALGVLKSAARTPILVGVVTGLILSGFDIALPDPLATIVTALGSAAAYQAIFTLGGQLASSPSLGLDRNALFVSAGKLLFHPALVALIAACLFLAGLEVNLQLITVAIFLAAMPSTSLIAVLAASYARSEVLAPATLMVHLSWLALMAALVALSLTILGQTLV